MHYDLLREKTICQILLAKFWIRPLSAREIPRNGNDFLLKGKRLLRVNSWRWRNFCIDNEIPYSFFGSKFYLLYDILIRNSGVEAEVDWLTFCQEKCTLIFIEKAMSCFPLVPRHPVYRTLTIDARLIELCAFFTLLLDSLDLVQMLDWIGKKNPRGVQKFCVFIRIKIYKNLQAGRTI